jgi:heme/copper-type cytochrome/quinol oxidase subunit 4
MKDEFKEKVEAIVVDSFAAGTFLAFMTGFLPFIFLTLVAFPISMKLK